MPMTAATDAPFCTYSKKGLSSVVAKLTTAKAFATTIVLVTNEFVISTQ